MTDYSESFRELKATRELNWHPYLGIVDIELEINEKCMNFIVSPIQASLIILFQNECMLCINLR